MSDLIQIAYITVNCPTCGVQSGISEAFVARRRQDGKDFYCPNGHVMTYGKGEMGRLRDEKARLQSQLDQANASKNYWEIQNAATERSLRSTRGVVTRIKSRVARGLCMCCSKKFADLEAHMKERHPEQSDKASQ